MGGRFGKYGDAKRKARIRSSRSTKRRGAQIKYVRERAKKKKGIKPQKAGNLGVSVEIKTVAEKELF